MITDSTEETSGQQQTTTVKSLTKFNDVIIGEEIALTEHYSLNICELPGVDLPCYGVIHRRYHVVEMSTSVLANARKFLEMLNRWEVSPPNDEVTNGLPDFADPSMFS